MKHTIKFDQIKENAKKGIAIYQYELAEQHIKEKEYAEAIYWLQKASQQGFYPAQERLTDVIKYGLRRK